MDASYDLSIFIYGLPGTAYVIMGVGAIDMSSSSGTEVAYGNLSGHTQVGSTPWLTEAIPARKRLNMPTRSTSPVEEDIMGSLTNGIPEEVLIQSVEDIESGMFPTAD